jgi:hypothetical protein
LASCSQNCSIKGHKGGSRRRSSSSFNKTIMKPRWAISEASTRTSRS